MNFCIIVIIFVLLVKLICVSYSYTNMLIFVVLVSSYICISLRLNMLCPNKVMLEGRVPDRGGRPNETRPPPEMPSFKQRTEAPQQQ